MGAKVGTDSSFDDLNLTPLIDVVLVVLIIMMVSIPIQVQEMGVKVPDPNQQPKPPRKCEALEVTCLRAPGSTSSTSRAVRGWTS